MSTKNRSTKVKAAKIETKKVRKSGSGRPVGAVSHAMVKLGDLNSILQPGASIPVSRVWLSTVMSNQVSSTPIEATPGKLAEIASNVNIQVHDFTEEPSTGLENGKTAESVVTA